MSLRPPTLSRLQDLLRLKSTVLQTPYNPLKLRTGIEHLTRPLKGPVLNSWYPPMVRDNIARQVLALPQGWVNEAEQHRVETNARLLARGKAKPKKGLGRRAVLRGAGKLK